MQSINFAFFLLKKLNIDFKTIKFYNRYRSLKTLLESNGGKL